MGSGKKADKLRMYIPCCAFAIGVNSIWLTFAKRAVSILAALIVASYALPATGKVAVAIFLRGQSVPRSIFTLIRINIHVIIDDKTSGTIFVNFIFGKYIYFLY